MSKRARTHSLVLRTPREHLDLNPFYRPSDAEYSTALREIRARRKTSHWIWYIFPQLALHGHSSQAVFYGIKSLPEA
eukprot:CAMPEP_0173230782 /NCGR_PEP_ID=MMETSP1142-20121109/7969_1 /TAXON_ID=483371 /ORGANISM="non described non described, Strain CCMP2298" /LENGTH=76 /DNA_ID=CAMNT_0014159965 /DNA_START=138 /DNA_END=364 /DNA_ORIENTATION=+